MPNLLEKTPVEDFKLTKEQRAFYKVFKKVNAISAMLNKGVKMQMGKLAGMQAMAQEIEGKKRELLLKAPDQSTLDSADEGMVETKQGGMGDEQLRNAINAQG